MPRRLSRGKLLLGVLSLGLGLGAAPATPSYLSVERAIEQGRKSAGAGMQAPPKAKGWNVFFDALLGELRTCTGATSENDRLASLNRLSKLEAALVGTSWDSGQTVQEELRAWL